MKQEKAHAYTLKKKVVTEGCIKKEDMKYRVEIEEQKDLTL